ncbi:MAG: sugar phosphate nucleotidyltransferase, partial [Thermodesulfovibrionales bacterium]|nr:sugar phosphate nucleotidyltransferase [Thermodesulfovibrionales bacterium]
MKVIILCGGMGTRLGSITDLIPKPMIEIGGKPILWHIMKIYSKYGFNDFIIALGYKGNVIKEYFYNFNQNNSDFTVDLRSGEIQFENCPYEDWKVTLADTGLDTLKGGRIKRVEKYLDSDINMLTYGDGVADINIKALVAFHKAHGKIITVSG